MKRSGARKNGARTRVWVLSILRIVIAGAILYVLVQYVSLEQVTHAFLAARFEYIAAALILGGANLCVQILKWRYFVRQVNPASSNLETVASLLFGITLGVVTPGQLGEFGGRAMRHHSLSSAKVVGLTIIDKLQMLLVMGIAAVVSYVTLFSLPAWQQTLVIAVVWIVFLYVFFRPSLIAGVFKIARFKILRHPWAKDLKMSLSLLGPKNLLAAFFFTCAFYVVVYVQMYFLLNAFSPVTWSDTFLGFAAMMFFKGIVPISFGDLGVREASSVYFYARVGVPEPTALDASLLLFVINIAIPALLGLLFIPKLPRLAADELEQANGASHRTT